MESIQGVLEKHTPELEHEVRYYLQSYFESVLEEEEEDYDKATLLNAMEGYLDKDECNLIIAEIECKRESQDKFPFDTLENSVKFDSLELQCNAQLGDEDPSNVEDGQEGTLVAMKEHTINDTTLERNSCNNFEDIMDIPEVSKMKSKSSQRREWKKQRRADKKNKSKSNRTNGSSKSLASSLEKKSFEPELINDDHASAWAECQESNRCWGGRGHGGRGIRASGDNLECIHLPCVSLCFQGIQLLVDSKMDILRGHRYGLLGRNGVGKSTLLRQLAAGRIPGLPRGMAIKMVRQQVEGREDQTTLEALVEADEYRMGLLKEQQFLEESLEDSVEDSVEAGRNLEDKARRLEEIAVELDAIDADSAEERALEILRGLCFTEEMILGATMRLSGGWRMRLALAQALFAPYSDLILLDECTNHLDLHGMAWLERFLKNGGSNHKNNNNRNNKNNKLTLICVSHDRNFLDAVCTDMIVMEHKRLDYHVGNYSDYQRKKQQKASRESQILDAAERQRSKALAFIQKQTNQRASTDPNKQRQAKMMRDKKLDRIGNYRQDGKRYKQNSLKKMSEDYVQLAQKVVVEPDDPIVRFNFPEPLWPPNVDDDTPIIRFEDVCFSYKPQSNHQQQHPWLLQHVTASLTRRSKIAIVGKNGCGKTTLFKLLTGQMQNMQMQKVQAQNMQTLMNHKDESSCFRGNIWKHPNIRLGHVSQHSIEELDTHYSQYTVLQYAQQTLTSGIASSKIISKASNNVRQYLGGFGLGSNHYANRLISELSGGERMRLCFATVMADNPHVLLLDESTNHVDLETLDSLASALRGYGGAVIMVSHNQSFLSAFCNELWAFQDNDLADNKYNEPIRQRQRQQDNNKHLHTLQHNKTNLSVSKNDLESFNDIFCKYKNQVLSYGAKQSKERTKERQIKTGMAKRANKQSVNVKQSVALL